MWMSYLIITTWWSADIVMWCTWQSVSITDTQTEMTVTQPCYSNGIDNNIVMWLWPVCVTTKWCCLSVCLSVCLSGIDCVLCGVVWCDACCSQVSADGATLLLLLSTTRDTYVAVVNLRTNKMTHELNVSGCHAFLLSPSSDFVCTSSLHDSVRVVCVLYLRSFYFIKLAVLCDCVIV